MTPITACFFTQSVLPDEAERRIVRCFGGEVACCARASRSRFGGGGFSLLFPLFPWIARSSPSRRRRPRRTLKQENAQQENAQQDNGPQQHAARDADGSGSLDAAWTRRRAASAAPYPQVRGLRRRVPNQCRRPFIDLIVPSLCYERRWYKVSLTNYYV